MGHRSSLTEFERGQIDALRSSKMSLRAIATMLDRSKTVVHAYVKDPDGYGVKKSSGRKSKLGPRAVRRIIKAANEGDSSASVIANTVAPHVSPRTVQRVLQRVPHLVYKKMKSTPMLTKRHREARLAWAKKQLKERTNWKKIIFSDEKRFTLDGPDGCKYYWHDIRREPRTFFSRQSGGGGIMVWGGFSAKGVTSLAILSGRQDSFDYQETLTNRLFPFADSVHDDGYVFQQDNASIHASRATTEFFSDLDIKVMQWPALSPDLNPIENLWGDMARAVYGNGRQYHSVSELEASVKKAWLDISPARLESLLKSMDDRCLEVVELKGSKTHY